MNFTYDISYSVAQELFQEKSYSQYCSKLCWARVCFAEILGVVYRYKIDYTTFNTGDTIQVLLRKIISEIVSNVISTETICDSLLGSEGFACEFVF